MTHVYFTRVASEPDADVKIGVAKNYAARISLLASQMGKDMEVLALVDGGRGLEREFHEMFRDYRREGEWFRPSDAMRELIASQPKPDIAVIKCGRVREKSADKWREKDRFIARETLCEVMAKFPREMTNSRVFECIFQDLDRRFGGWTRRRVRAIYNGEAVAIEHYEIEHLQKLVTGD